MSVHTCCKALDFTARVLLLLINVVAYIHVCIYQVWGILASVLHIASLEFTTEDTAEGDIVHLDPIVQQVCRHCTCVYI